VGDSITLDGSGFDPDPFHMQVKFSNNIAAEVVSSSATRLVVKVPAGAVSGPITVINGLTGQSDTSDTAFTVTDDGGGSTSQWVSRASPSSYLLNGVAYGYSSHTFVAVGYGQTILTSSDGLSWSRSTAPDAEFYEGKAVAWTGSRFVMVGDQSYGSSLPALIATSPDGITWTRRSWSQSVSSETLVSVATGGGKITAVGLNGSVIASSDGGLTWVSENPGASVAFSSVTGTDSTRVAVGRDSSNEGVILVDRGSGWTRVSGLSSFVPRQVIWAGGQFLAVGSTSVGLGSPAIATSPDGTTWTRRALAPTEAPAGFPLSAVHLKDGVLYAAGDNFGNQHVILQSNNGGASWQVVHQAQLTGIAMLAGFASSAERIVSVGGVKSVTLP
jgi:photosystem II stability/assembly factor-like uncharacterized protein